MNCDNFQVWRPLPVGSKFVISGSGDETLFNVSVGVNANGKPEAFWRHDDIVPGPKERTIGAGDICTFNIMAVVTTDPPAGTPVELDAHIELPDGSTHPDFDCAWSFLHAGQFPITIFAQNL